MLTLIATPLWWLFTLCNLFFHLVVLTMTYLCTGRHLLMFMRSFGRMELLGAGVRLDIVGRNNIPKDGGVLIASNHKSYFDIFSLLVGSPRALRWVLKESLLTYPFLGVFLRQSRAIGLNRDNPGQAARVLVQAIRSLKDGDAFVVFPEGTRIEGPGLGEFKGGVFQLSIKTGCPVIPVVIHGSSDVISAKKLWVHPFKKIKIEFLEPIDPECFVGDRSAFSEAVRQRIEDRLIEAISCRQPS